VPPRLHAILLLAWALVRTVFRRLFVKSRDGIAQFRENYDADRLPPVTPDERLRLQTFGRCIACGLCDRGESGRIAESAGAYRGVMSLMLASSRSMPDFRAAAISFAFVPDQVLAEKEAICPTEVPMREIARFVRDKARELERSLPPPPVAERAKVRARREEPELEEAPASEV
jgi:hypothetical protein